MFVEMVKYMGYPEFSIIANKIKSPKMKYIQINIKYTILVILRIHFQNWHDNMEFA